MGAGGRSDRPGERSTDGRARLVLRLARAQVSRSVDMADSCWASTARRGRRGGLIHRPAPRPRILSTSAPFRRRRPVALNSRSQRCWGASELVEFENRPAAVGPIPPFKRPARRPWACPPCKPAAVRRVRLRPPRRPRELSARALRCTESMAHRTSEEQCFCSRYRGTATKNLWRAPVGQFRLPVKRPQQRQRLLNSRLLSCALAAAPRD